MRKYWHLLLGVGISIIFLWLALRGQDLDQVRRALGEANYRYLPAALALYFAGVWARTLRWRQLLKLVRPLTAGALFPVIVVGFMANNLLPWRLGEIVRAYMLRERTGIPPSISLATIAVERIFDGLTLLGFLLVASLFIPLNEQLRNLAITATLIFGTLLLVLTIVVRSGRTRAWLLGVVARLLPASIATRLAALIENVVAGLQALRSRDSLVLVAGSSLLAWALESAMYLVIAPAFAMPFSPAAALMTMAVSNLATLIPSAPGYVGIFEGGALLVLSGLLNMEKERALSYAIVVHAALYFPVTLWGMYYWARTSLSWATVREIGERSSAHPATGAVAD